MSTTIKNITACLSNKTTLLLLARMPSGLQLITIVSLSIRYSALIRT